MGEKDGEVVIASPWMKVPRAIALCMVVTMLLAPLGYAQTQPPAAPMSSEEPPVTRPGPAYTLEAGYGLTKLAGDLGFVVGVTSDPGGNVYVVTNACPVVNAAAFAGNKSAADAAKFGWGELIRIAPDGSRTTLLSEQQGQLKCSLNGVTYHDGKLYSCRGASSSWNAQLGR